MVLKTTQHQRWPDLSTISFANVPTLPFFTNSPCRKRFRATETENVPAFVDAQVRGITIRVGFSLDRKSALNVAMDEGPVSQLLQVIGQSTIQICMSVYGNLGRKEATLLQQQARDNPSSTEDGTASAGTVWLQPKESHAEGVMAVPIL